MRGKLALLFGFGLGYVLGSKAGRERYDQLKRGWLTFWESPRVQKQIHSAEEFARDKAPDVVDFLSDTAKKVVSRSSKATTDSGASSSKNASKAKVDGSPASTAPKG